MNHDELNILNKQLTNQDSASLTNFILNIAMTNDEVYQAVKIFAQRNEPQALVKSIHDRLTGLKRDTHYYNWRDSHVLERKLKIVLDLIKDEVLIAQPDKAIELLGTFMELDEYVFEHVDDSYGTFGMLFHEIAELFMQTCRSSDDAELRTKWLKQLTNKNDYGARNCIFDLAASV